MDLVKKVLKKMRGDFEDNFDVSSRIPSKELLVLLRFIKKTLTEKTVKPYEEIPEDHRFSQIVVIGDLHGSIFSMNNILNQFNIEEGSGGEESFSNTLFVLCGDVIDRGCFSLEMFLTFFCMKIVHNNVIYLKGNHETEEFQARQTRNEKTIINQIILFYFKDKTIFGDDPWWIWKEFYKKNILPFENTPNNVRKNHPQYELIFLTFDLFALLPFSCYLKKEKIFCMHGGFPNQYLKGNSEEKNQKLDLSLFRSDGLKMIPKYHRTKHSLEYQILWNDTYEEEEEEEEEEESLLFHMARRRTQISVTYQFSEEVTKLFIENTKKELGREIDFVVRGHTHAWKEKVIDGYRICHQGNVITLLSCYNLAQMGNDGAYLVVKDEEVKIYRFDKNGCHFDKRLRKK